jgi:signal peptidase I
VSATKEQAPRKRPWRDNIEAVTMALVMAVMLKYFIVEAYKIPTGSMQPTLLGNDDTNIYDRILVDKASYHFRDPERFEVAVFRYPLDRSKNFIKRIVGMPDEELRIRNGDLWTRKDAKEEWRILRRPRNVQHETWKRLASSGEWRVEGSSRGWEVEGDQIRAAGEGSARFPRERNSVRDDYTDGYPGSMAEKLKRTGRGSGTNDVGDLRIEGTVEARADCNAVEIEFDEGPFHHRIVLPGPAAPEDSVVEISSESSTQANGSAEPRVRRGESPWRLPAGRRVEFDAQNLDDLLEVEIEGAGQLALEVRDTGDQTNSRVRLTTRGGGASFRSLTLWRDIYYTAERNGRDSWAIPPASYFMMGDNTQDSADSREWHYVQYRLGSGESASVVRGNDRRGENPIEVPGGVRGVQTFLRDEWGERHVFEAGDAVRIPDEACPFVPRSLMTGRALLVFWPFVPSLGVYRLKWIH